MSLDGCSDAFDVEVVRASHRFPLFVQRIDDGVRMFHTIVPGDSSSGSNALFRRGLERLGLRYGLAIRRNLTMWTSGARRARSATVIGAAEPDRDWHRVR